ncbi:MAG: HDOD domain-containing protein [Paraglaciecola sp.]
MTSPATKTPIVEARFKQLFIDLKAAKQQLADENSPRVAKEVVPTRELLAVEKQAREDKKLSQEKEDNRVESVAAKLHQEIELKLSEALSDPEFLITKVLAIDMAIPKILDLLAVKACTVSRLEVLATEVPWLYKDLLKMINSAKYRRRDSKGKIISADTLRVALTFFGIDNLKMVVPFLLIRRHLPQITDPYPHIKRRIWEQSIATAMSSKRLAPFYQLDENQAFTAGMLQNLGPIAVIKLYFRLFDQIQLSALKEAEDTLKHQRHSALTKVEPSGELLLSLLDKYATKATADIIDGLGFTRLPLSGAFAQLAQAEPPATPLPLVKVLKQSNAYGKYRILKFHELVSNDEAKDYLRQFAFPVGSLESLKTTDMRSIGLETDNSE